jgi:hypothetical protein
MREVNGSELLAGSDHEFVVNLYTVILNRWPDEDGYRHYLQRIENRPDIRRQAIQDVAGSAEARALDVVLTFADDPPPAADPVAPIAIAAAPPTGRQAMRSRRCSRRSARCPTPSSAPFTGNSPMPWAQWRRSATRDWKHGWRGWNSGSAEVAGALPRSQGALAPDTGKMCLATPHSRKHRGVGPSAGRWTPRSTPQASMAGGRDRPARPASPCSRWPTPAAVPIRCSAARDSQRLFENAGTGPLPHPATHPGYCRWVAGWGRGPVPGFRMRLSAHSQTVSQRSAMRPSGGTPARRPRAMASATTSSSTGPVS